jgi:hypothetical protein
MSGTRSPGAGYTVALTAAALASLGALAVVRRTPQLSVP